MRDTMYNHSRLNFNDLNNKKKKRVKKNFNDLNKIKIKKKSKKI